MNSDYSDAVAAAVKWLVSQQSTAGSFVCQASSQPDNFSKHEEHPTIFFTALILECIRDASSSGKLQTAAASYLKRHMSQQATWNYWERDSSFAQRQPYPEDLDDTACALSALIHHKPSVATGKLQAQVAQVLIATEQTPGGPYSTWLIDAERYPVWQDVDLAVNANVAYMLSLLGVTLPPLQAYLGEQIKAGSYRSTYYVGEAPVVYFLARGYSGPARAQLKRRVGQLLRQAVTTGNSLELALLISSGMRVGLPPTLLARSARRLLALRVEQHWEAFALYYEPLIKGVRYYAGSSALTTAFCIEALTGQEIPTETPGASSPPVFKPKLLSPQLHKTPELRATHDDLLAKLITSDSDHQITDIASLTAQACGSQPAAHQLALLNTGSTYGWLAYTVYDDVMDGESDASLLPLAHIAQRHMLASFREAQPDKAFQAHIAAILLAADEANLWEARHCRLNATKRRITQANLPDFGQPDSLAGRSMGHSLAPAGTLLALGHGLQGPRQKAQRSFFQHYLTARQLVDDAHDWEADLQAGRLTIANCLVLRAYLSAHPAGFDRQQASAWRELRVLFWQHTILETSKLVEHQLRAAHASLKTCKFSYPDQHELWLNRLQQAITEAREQRTQTRAFLRTFG